MFKKVLSQKRYLCAVLAIALLWVFAVGSAVWQVTSLAKRLQTAADDSSFSVIFGFENDHLAEMLTPNVAFPVAYISTTDFEEMVSSSDYTIHEPFDVFAEYNCRLMSVTYLHVNEDLTFEAAHGTYLMKGDLVYATNYVSCNFWEYDIDNDGEDELIFFTSDNTKHHICTYYVIEKNDDFVAYARYSASWAVSPTDLGFETESKIDEIDERIIGHLVYQPLEDGTPFYSIDAGEYTEHLWRCDGQDK